MFLQRSLALLVSSLCSSVIWWVGALKYDMTVRNSSKPISCTDPTSSFWKFLCRTSKYSNMLLLHISFVEPWMLNFTINLQVCGCQMNFWPRGLGKNRRHYSNTISKLANCFWDLSLNICFLNEIKNVFNLSIIIRDISNNNKKYIKKPPSQMMLAI